MAKIKIENIKKEFEEICKSAISMAKNRHTENILFYKVQELFLKYGIQEIKYSIVCKGNTVLMVPKRPIDELAIYAIMHS